MPEIVSVSRRTDVPAFFWDEFLNILRRGKAVSRNPFNGREKEVSLRRDDVLLFVFWTKNPSRLVRDLPRLLGKGYRCVVHVTVNGYPPVIEKSIPPASDVASSLRALSRILGREKVFWRFDPLLPGESPDETLQRFQAIADLIGESAGRIYTSAYQPYRKTLGRLEKAGVDPRGPVSLEAAFKVREEARRRGIPLFSCCSPLLSEAGIAQGACIDGEYLSKIFPDVKIDKRNNPTREGCLCTDSRDIGFYRTCRGGCIYCYAS
ncbi:MAG: DUF1848 family protein [Deltaproteobacteria bacterium]|nr:MAG: DUF1848 family protein [Deltaproteobacteria bacterium]